MLVVESNDQWDVEVIVNEFQSRNRDACGGEQTLRTKGIVFDGEFQSRNRERSIKNSQGG